MPQENMQKDDTQSYMFEEVEDMENREVTHFRLFVHFTEQMISQGLCKAFHHQD